VIQDEEELSLLERLIRDNDFISAVDKTGIVVFAPTNSQLRPLLDRGVPTTSFYFRRTLLHHIVTMSSLGSSQLTTLNGNITNTGTSTA
jgi:hypothetical protein